MGAGGAVAYLQLGGDSVLLSVLLVCGGQGGRRGGGPRVFRDGPPQLHVGLRAVDLLRVRLLHRQTGKNKRSYRESITQTNSNILSLSLLLSVIRVKSCNNGNNYATASWCVRVFLQPHLDAFSRDERLAAAGGQSRGGREAASRRRRRRRLGGFLRAIPRHCELVCGEEGKKKD